MSGKSQILIMAGVLALALVGFVVFFLQGGNQDEQRAEVETQGNMVGGPATETPVEERPGYAPPPPPSVKSVEAIGALADPFKGRPWSPPPPPPPPPPPEIRVRAIPPISPQLGRYVSTGSSGPASVAVRDKEPPLGRHAGWIFNSNGQVVAIFEDKDGIARAVRVGDEIEGANGLLRVKAIARDHLVLVNEFTGREEKLVLQGLDTYPWQTREVQVEATPDVPRWGAR